MGACRPPGVPDWSGEIISILKSGSSRRLLGLPGAPSILNDLGVRDLRVEGYGPVKWVQSRLYEVSVNGGGLESELPEDPEDSFTPGMPRIRVSELLKGLPWRGPGEPVRGFLNPLGWRPYLPIRVRGEEGLPGCISLEGYSYSRAPLEPLNTSRSLLCGKGASSQKGALISYGPYRIRVEGEVYAGGGINVYLGDEYTLYWDSRGLVALSEGGASIKISHPYRDLRVSSLYVLAFYERRLKPGAALETSSAAIRGPGGSLAVGAPEGVKITHRPGETLLEFRGALALTSGGSVEAYRILLESSFEWEILGGLPEDGVGHIRSYAVSPLASEITEEKLVISFSNPHGRGGLLEVLTRIPIRKVSIETILGAVEIPVAGHSARIPITEHACGRVTLEVRRRPWLLAARK